MRSVIRLLQADSQEELIGLLAAVVLVGALVFIHEFGHFIVAKACRVDVPVFSLGFGRRLFGVKIGGTDYRVSALPFGGYVQMAGADPFGYLDDEESLTDPSRAFLNKPLWQRILVIAAGPAMNLALPFLVFTVVLMAGEPKPAASIGSLAPDSPLAEAGLRAGDTVVSVDDDPTPTMEHLGDALAELGPGPHALTLDRHGAQRVVRFEVGADGLDLGALQISGVRPAAIVAVDDPASPAGRAGLTTGERVVAAGGAPVADWLDLQDAVVAAGEDLVLTVADEDGAERAVTLHADPAWAPRGEPLPADPSLAWGLLPSEIFIDAVSTTVQDEGGLFSGCAPGPAPPPSPAQLAGLQAGDRFLRVDGLDIHQWDDVLTAVSNSMEGEGDAAHARDLEVEVIRAGRLVTLSLTPKVVESTDTVGRFYHRPMIGVLSLQDPLPPPTVRRYYPFPQAVAKASVETVAIGAFMVEQIGRITTGEASFRKNVGGPIEMVRQASAAAKRGIFEYVRLMGILSISLGIVNLLPVPVLDGGQLLFFFMEAIRGRPVSVAFRERAQQLGVVFMVVLMLTVVVVDVQRCGGGPP